jgi:hypothetical protein
MSRMTIDELVVLAQSRLSTLNTQRADAVTRGDVAALARLDAEIAETEHTLAQLQTLLT